MIQIYRSKPNRIFFIGADLYYGWEDFCLVSMGALFYKTLSISKYIIITNTIVKVKNIPKLKYCLIKEQECFIRYKETRR